MQAKCCDCQNSLVVLLSIDKRCETANGRHRVEFYRDASRTSLIRHFSGAVGSFRDFVIPDNQFWFAFESGSDMRLWGYKITIQGLGMRLRNDKEAMKESTFFLACEILEVVEKDWDATCLLVFKCMTDVSIADSAHCARKLSSWKRGRC